MSIKRSLVDYLLDRRDLDGLPAKPFASPRDVSGFVVKNRNDARRAIQSKVGDRIYFDRRPQDIKDHTAIILQTLASDQEYGTIGQADGTEELLRCTVFARTGDAGRRAETVGDLLSLAVSGYAGDSWGGTYIGECRIESQLSTADAPPDATDDWLFQRTIDLSVLAFDPSAAVYAEELLAAAFTWGLNPGQSDDLRLSADSTVVPHGRTLADIAWTIRTGSDSGPVAVEFNGLPDASPGDAGISGTTKNPAVDRATYGLTGVFVHVSLSVTDDAGSVATYAEGRNE